MKLPIVKPREIITLLKGKDLKNQGKVEVT